MCFNHFFNLCEKCQSDIYYKTDGIYNIGSGGHWGGDKRDNKREQ